MGLVALASDKADISAYNSEWHCTSSKIPLCPLM